MTLIKNKFNRIKLLNKILLFFLILSGGSYLCTMRPTYLGLLVLTLFFTLFLILINVKHIQSRLFSEVILACLVIATIFFMNIIFSEDDLTYNQYIVLAVQFILGALVLIYYKSIKYPFINDLYFVLKIILYQSLASFSLWFLLRGHLQPSIFEFTDTYYYLFFYENMRGIYNVNGIDIIRNSGLFWEPGILQYYMNVLFFLALFFFKDKKIIFLSTLSIMTTWSTAGYIIWIFITISYVVSNLKKKKVALLLPFIFFVAVLIYPVIESNIKEKFEGDSSSSALMREYNTLIALLIISDHPWSGIGLDWENHQQVLVKYEPKMDFFISDPRGAGTSNSLLNILVYFGIPFGILFFIMFYQQNYIYQFKNVFFFITILGIISEPIFLFTFFTIFMVSGLTNMLIKLKKR